MASNKLKKLLHKCAVCYRGQNRIVYTLSWLDPRIMSTPVIVKHGEDGFLQFGDLNVYSWSISGLETSVVVKRPSDGFSCCFDLGCTNRQNLQCDTVFISHGHLDHIAALPHHIRKREMLGSKPSTYYVPEHLVDNLKEVCQTYAKISENDQELECQDPKQLSDADIRGVLPGQQVQLSRGYFAVPFPTIHRAKSQGYIVYSTSKKKLKPEYQGLSPKDIGALIRSGENVHQESVIIPEIAYTGDTTFEVFTNAVHTPPDDLFRVKLLIVEATYINDDKDIKDRVKKARQWGHIHLSEIYENAALFRNVDNILLMHLSDKYSCGYVYDKVYENIPEELRGKVFVSTLAKERYL